jgi:glycosyltransferase involved in cell wall biosynthesis
MGSKEKIAFVIHRAGSEFSGGAEGYCLTLAQILAATHDVEILTTTAKNHETWANEYDEGTETLESGAVIRRFPIAIGRSDYWHNIHSSVTTAVGATKGEILPGQIHSVALGIQEHWLMHQGPHSVALNEYIADHADDYDHIVLVTYLYSPTYFACQTLKGRKNVYIISTYHNEWPAYMPIFLNYAKFKHFFLTPAEKCLAEESIFGEPIESRLLGYGVTDYAIPATSLGATDRYFIYVGRLEAAKGVADLYRMFELLAADERYRDVKLITIGSGGLKDYQHPNIIYRGFVSEEEKYRLIHGAVALVHPSPYESLSIVLLEAFMLGVPGIVNNASAVMREHIDLSGAGYYYLNDEDFVRCAREILELQESTTGSMKTKARQYYLDNYSESSFRDRVHQMFKGWN